MATMLACDLLKTHNVVFDHFEVLGLPFLKQNHDKSSLIFQSIED